MSMYLVGLHKKLQRQRVKENQPGCIKLHLSLINMHMYARKCIIRVSKFADNIQWQDNQGFSMKKFIFPLRHYFFGCLFVMNFRLLFPSTKRLFDTGANCLPMQTLMVRCPPQVCAYVFGEILGIIQLFLLTGVYIFSGVYIKHQGLHILQSSLEELEKSSN